MNGMSSSPFAGILLTLISDYNFVLDGNECVLAGPQQIPEGECKNSGDKFMGSSGYRKVPGNTCIPHGRAKDALKLSDCSQGISRLL